MESDSNSDRKLARKNNVSNKYQDQNIVDENKEQKKHQRYTIKTKKEELDQEEWEYWKEYYK